MKYLKATALWIIAASFFASGCSSIVADRISRQQSYDYSWFVTAEELTEKGFEKHRYCSVQQGLCLSYFIAQPLSRQRQFQFDMVVNGDPINLQLKRSQLPQRFKGTVVLLHGFAISKEYMAMAANYFRFLGFHVIVPDMLGHGESDGNIAFGVADTQLVDELINHQTKIHRPLFVFGNSMGAVTATHLASVRDDVEGIILQAPMLPFDNAAVNYIKFDSPLLATLVTERSIRKGARKALNKVPVPLAQTDIKPALAAADVPVLILASSADTIAPFNYFKPLANEQVSVAEIKDRNHYSMVVLDQADSDHILQWMQDLSGSPTSTRAHH